MAKERALTIKFLADVKEFVKGTALGGQAVEGMAGKLGGLAGTIGSAYAVGKVVEFGKASVQAAQEDAQAQVVLASTLRSTTGATDAQVAAVEDFIAKTQDATGVMDDDLRPAFANLVRVTKDAGQAQDLLTLAMDISASTGKDLESVSMALARAHEGSTSKLKALGIETKDAEGKAVSFAEVQRQLTEQFGGAQAAAADTAAGKMAIMQARYADLQETIGAALLPVMSELVGVVSSVFEWFSSLDESTQQWIVRIALLGGGLMLATRAFVGAKEAITGVKAAMTGLGLAEAGALGPLAAVAALVAGGILVYKALSGSKAKTIDVTEDLTAALKAEAAGQKGAAQQAIAAAVESALANENVARAMKALGLEARDLGAAMVGTMTPAMQAAKDRFDELNGSYGTATKAAKEYRAETGLGAWAAKDLFDTVGSLQTQFDSATAAQEASATVMDQVASATKGATKATKTQAEADKDAADAAQKHEDAIRDLFDAIVGAADGSLRYRDAQRSVKDSISEVADVTAHLTDTNADTRTSLDDLAAALDDAQGSMMDQASAAADLAQAQAEANGKTFTAADRAAAYRSELLKLSATLGPGDPLRAGIDGLIRDLDRIPSSKTVRINVTGGRVTPTTGTTFIEAGGGDAVPGAAHLVGEVGPELFVPDQPGTIVPANKLQSIARRGGSTLSVTVNVAGSVRTERDLVDAIHEGLLRKQRSSGSLALV